MQIKFNKLVKPVVPLSEGEISQAASAPATDDVKSSAIDQALASQAPKVPASQMDEIPAAPAPVAEEAAFVEKSPAPVEEAPAPVETNSVPDVEAPASIAVTRKIGKIEDTMKQFVGKQVRIYMADHEYVAGLLTIVENGWVKICNARSAGSDYYFDEDIINTENIVRVRVTLPIDKKQYVDFMNSN